MSKSTNLTTSPYIWTAISLTSLTLLSFLVLTSSIVSAESTTVSNVSITVPVSCNMATGSNATNGSGTDGSTNTDTPHTATINNGTFKENIGTTTFKVFCNDNNGYSVYAIGYSGNEFGNTNMLATVNNTPSPTDNITTGLTTSGNTSSWSMKLLPVDGTYKPTILSAPNEPGGIDASFSDYHTIPNTYTKVATLASNTDFTLGSAFQTTYRVYVSNKQPAGTYEGKVKYTLIHPNDGDKPLSPQNTTPGYIGYYPNATNVADTMDDKSHIINATDTSTTLWASNFKREGYGFVGWSDKYDWIVNNQDENGNGTGPNAGYHIYGPNETINFTAGQYTGQNKGLSLYAVWVKSQGTIQNWNGCNAMNIGDVTALTDQRDNDTYAVAKLKDGKCWMIENLRLDNDATTGNNQYDPSVTNESLAQGYAKSATYGNFVGLAEPETANFLAINSSTSTYNSLYYFNAKEGTANININNTSSPYHRMPRFNNNNTNSNSAINPNITVPIMTSAGQNVYSYGNYYAWAAAIASTSHYYTDNQSVTTTSLCPKGWKLPTGGRAYAPGNTSGVNVTGNKSTFRDFYNLGYVLMGSNKTAYEDTPDYGWSGYSDSTINLNGDTAWKAFGRYPNNFLYSGYFIDYSSGSVGGGGAYWSNTTYSDAFSYLLDINSSIVSPGTVPISKVHGASIRCIVGS